MKYKNLIEQYITYILIMFLLATTFAAFQHGIDVGYNRSAKLACSTKNTYTKSCILNEIQKIKNNKDGW
jgi:hypothetical protein